VAIATQSLLLVQYSVSQSGLHRTFCLDAISISVITTFSVFSDKLYSVSVFLHKEESNRSAVSSTLKILLLLLLLLLLLVVVVVVVVEEEVEAGVAQSV
jgi:uncharacterized membrane-anchored protein